MRLLLDTQVFLWSEADPSRLGSLQWIVADTENDVFVSAATAWEIAIKYGLGKLSLTEHPRDYLPSRMSGSAFAPLAIQNSHALAVTDLPPHHHDPFDRLLIAQAEVEGLTIATADETFLRYTDRVLMP